MEGPRSAVRCWEKPCVICHEIGLYTGFARACHVHAPTLDRLCTEFLLSGPFWQTACAFLRSAPAGLERHVASLHWNSYGRSGTRRVFYCFLLLLLHDARMRRLLPLTLLTSRNGGRWCGRAVHVRTPFIFIRLLNQFIFLCNLLNFSFR